MLQTVKKIWQKYEVEESCEKIRKVEKSEENCEEAKTKTKWKWAKFGNLQIVHCGQIWWICTLNIWCGQSRGRKRVVLQWESAAVGWWRKMLSRATLFTRCSLDSVITQKKWCECGQVGSWGTWRTWRTWGTWRRRRSDNPTNNVTKTLNGSLTHIILELIIWCKICLICHFEIECLYLFFMLLLWFYF